MHPILILGSGKIGKLAAALLAESGDYHVFLADLHRPSDVPYTKTPIAPLVCDINDDSSYEKIVRGHKIETVVSCLPYFCNPKVAKGAEAWGLNYFGLTEDVKVANRIRNCTPKPGTLFLPQCGLAPGFISIVTSYLMSSFETVENVKMCVGALPLNVSNPLQYALNWSVDGIINEYGNGCEILREGEKEIVPALEGLQEIKLDGITYEAFYTSGGVGTLTESCHGKVQNMCYKTIRYPGHCKKMQFLMNDLHLNEKRETLKSILKECLPETKRDVVLVYVSIDGNIQGQYFEENYAEKFYSTYLFGKRWSAIQMTTASSLCASIDLSIKEKLFEGPFINQEEIPLESFLENRFGNFYKKSERNEELALIKKQR
jgi:saccharopine dehydrogenase-like NADP-dependent oxidoreductase